MSSFRSRPEVSSSVPEEEEDEHAWKYELKEQSRIDCMDTENIWCPATIIGISELTKRFKIRYEAWGEMYDEWISIKSNRFARYKSHQWDYRYPKSFGNSPDFEKSSFSHLPNPQEPLKEAPRAPKYFWACERAAADKEYEDDMEAAIIASLGLDDVKDTDIQEGIKASLAEPLPNNISREEQDQQNQFRYGNVMGEHDPNGIEANNFAFSIGSPTTQAKHISKITKSIDEKRRIHKGCSNVQTTPDQLISLLQLQTLNESVNLDKNEESQICEEKEFVVDDVPPLEKLVNDDDVPPLEKVYPILPRSVANIKPPLPQIDDGDCFLVVDVTENKVGNEADVILKEDDSDDAWGDIDDDDLTYFFEEDPENDDNFEESIDDCTSPPEESYHIHDNGDNNFGFEVVDL